MKNKGTAGDTEKSTWERVMHFEKDPSPAAARALLKLRFSPHDRQRMRTLSAKARAGSLTDQEKTEIDKYEHLGCVLDILHSNARRVLKNRRGAS